MTKQTTKPAVQLSDTDKRQITDEAISRGAIIVADQYTLMDRATLDKLAEDYEIDTTDMDDFHVRDALREADAAIDTSGEDDFEEGTKEFERRKQLEAEEAARVAAQEAELEARASGATPVQALQVHHTALPKNGADGFCPHCGTSTRGGNEVTEFAEMSPGSQRDTNQMFTCNKCAGEWGPVVDKPKTARAPSGSSNGLKIEQNRETRNNITRPSIGGKCRGVWDMLDAIGSDATAKQAREQAVVKGFDKTTTMVQFYRWRKFNGIEGRQ